MKIKLFKIKRSKSVDPSVIERAKKEITVMSVYSLCCLSALITSQKTAYEKFILLFLSISLFTNTIIDFLTKKEIHWITIIVFTLIFSVYLLLMIKRNYKYYLNQELEDFNKAEEKLYKNGVKDEINNMINDIGNKRE